LGVYPVTQAEYERVVGRNPSCFKWAEDPTMPVESVSWKEAVEFCRRLSRKEGKKYRLPTEAEWEYACRARGSARYSFGDDFASLGDYAWYCGNSDSRTHPVGQKKPNAWGLYDMHGNVWEWCADWYAEDCYATSPPNDPAGPSSGVSRAVRGGSYGDVPSFLRSAKREGGGPAEAHEFAGFRAARTS